VTETEGAPGADLRCDFENVTGAATSLAVHLNGHYHGNAGHNLQVEVYNWNTTTFDVLSAPSTTIPGNSSTDADYVWNLTSANHKSGSNVVRVRFDHTSSGNINHDIDLDYVYLDAPHETPTPTATP